MSKRQRGSALSEELIASVRFELARKRWSQDFWADEAHLSVSTVKRLLQGKRLDPATLEAALGALGLSINKCVIQSQPESTVSDLSNGNAHTPHNSLGFYMIATFIDTKRPQIESALKGLKALLVDSEVIFHDDESGLTVSGAFDKQNKKQIEMTIKHLMALFTTCRVTGDITCKHN